MADEKPKAETTDAAKPAAAPEGDEPKYELYQARKGWVKGSDGRFHEVDDVDATLAAYPGQYEEVKSSEVTKSKVGWPEEAQA